MTRDTESVSGMGTEPESGISAWLATAICVGIFLVFVVAVVVSS
jgi:hypothetical protein